MDTIVPVPWTSLPSQTARFLASDVASKLHLTQRHCLGSLAPCPHIVFSTVNLVNSLGENSPCVSLLMEFTAYNEALYE